MCPNELILSILSGKNCDLWFAEKFRNRDLKPPTPMCRSWNPTPKQKNCSEKGFHMREMSLFENHLYSYFFWIIVIVAPKNKEKNPKNVRSIMSNPLSPFSSNIEQATIDLALIPCKIWANMKIKSTSPQIPTRRKPITEKKKERGGKGLVWKYENCILI